MTERPELDLLGTWVRATSVRTRLLAWYDRTRRDLPWRRDRDPYRVLVSELMLQQTRVEAAIPYFERWMAVFPSFEALASAPEEEVLAAWSGLGYYRRARYLREIARAVVASPEGRLPEDAEALRKLPGIGPYTAAAVASIAFGKPVAVVDGNVERVVSRLLCLQDEPGAARDRVVREAARRIVTGTGAGPDALPPAAPPDLRPGDLNQAMMELGATVCLPSTPDCARCPLAKTCVGHRAGLAAKLPKPKPRREPIDVPVTVLVVRRRRSRGGAGRDEVLMTRRPLGGRMELLWELPTTPVTAAAAADPVAARTALIAQVAERIGATPALTPRPARRFRHSITHHRIAAEVYEIAAPPRVPRLPEGWRWVAASSLGRIAASSMARKALPD